MSSTDIQADPGFSKFEDGLGSSLGYTSLRQKIDEVVDCLGGHDFARLVVTKTAGDHLERLVRDSMDWKRSRHLFNSAFLMASESDFKRTVAMLERYFVIQCDLPTPAMVSEPVACGRFILRGTELNFETVRARIPMALGKEDHMTTPDAPKWMVSVYDTHMKPFVGLVGGKEPSASYGYTKSEAGAVKLLVRIAKEVFNQPLMKPG